MFLLRLADEFRRGIGRVATEAVLFPAVEGATFMRPDVGDERLVPCGEGDRFVGDSGDTLRGNGTDEGDPGFRGQSR